MIKFPVSLLTIELNKKYNNKNIGNAFREFIQLSLINLLIPFDSLMYDRFTIKSDFPTALRYAIKKNIETATQITNTFLLLRSMSVSKLKIIIGTARP